MLKNTEKLEFSPADEPGKTFLYWEKGFHRSETLGNSPRPGCRQDGKMWIAFSTVTRADILCGHFAVPYRLNKGRVSGTGSDRRWYIDKVIKVLFLSSELFLWLMQWRLMHVSPNLNESVFFHTPVPSTWSKLELGVLLKDTCSSYTWGSNHNLFCVLIWSVFCSSLRWRTRTRGRTSRETSGIKRLPTWKWQ